MSPNHRTLEGEVVDDLGKSGSSRLDALEVQGAAFSAIANKLQIVAFVFTIFGVAGLGGALTVRDVSRDTSTRVTSLESRLTQDESTLRDTGNELREMRVALSRMQVLMERVVDQLDGLGRRLDRGRTNSPHSESPP